MVIGNLGCLTHGAAMIYPSEGFDPLATLETMATERCTAVYGVPTMFIAEMGSIPTLRNSIPPHCAPA
jgi:fatty-acyl-CoA synthase